jgi:hypothetical protein
MRWVPFEMNEQYLRDQIKNKMIRPTTIPQTYAGLIVEQALAREALRLSLEQHKLLATGLKGVQRVKSLDEAFSDSGAASSYINMLDLDLLVGSGGVLSHAPRRAQTMHMLLDAFQPGGVTFLGVDSIFMMPHLGVLAQVNTTASSQVFERDCMIYLGSVIAPYGSTRPGDPVMEYNIDFGGGRTESGTLKFGELKLFGDFPVGAEGTAEVKPAKRFDMGEGPGKPVKRSLRGGVVGLALDGRGRPIALSPDDTLRCRQLIEWGEIMGSYENVAERIATS